MQTASETDGNVTKVAFDEFFEEYLDVDAAVDQAKAMRLELRKRIKGAGFSLAAFDRTRKEAGKSADVREEEDRQFRRNMAWLGKPLGHQGDMFSPPPPNGEDVTDKQVYQVELAGRSAGEQGHNRSTNPWGEGSTLRDAWDRGWHTGQDILADKQFPGARRGPGRPRKQLPKPEEAAND